MSSNRYGQIWHGDHHHINIRFPSNEARLKFQEDFEAYHQSHDHDGDAPTFKAVTTKDLKLSTGSRSPEDVSERDITIDGYHWSEIRSYQDNQDLSDYNWYRPPTCCVPPTIVIDSKYVSSADLKRHPLSAIFGNMPDSDFQSLLSSVESDGFIEPVIRMYEGQILDGWHRYRAAQELGIIRKLRFREWNEDSHRDGDPKIFVLARNIERRHLNAAQRAQIAVTFNERFGMGRPTDLQKVHQNGELKTRSELATEANVGTSTIDRAVQVEKAGRAEEVISGEKSASEIIKELTVDELWKQINPAISAWKKEREGVGHASKTMFIRATLRWEGLPSDTETDVKVLKELLNLLTTKETNILEELIRKQLDGKSLWDDAESGTTEQQETVKDLWAKVSEEIPKWKAREKEKCQYPSDSIGNASKSMLIEALRQCDIDNDNEGSATAEELKVLLNRMQADDFPLVVAVRDVLKDRQQTGEKETAQPSQTAEEREANKELKQKKQVIKSIWDKRKQATRDWLGTEDNDLTTYTDLDELEKAFAKCDEHAYCADAFQSGMRRTAEQTFNICLEKMLASDVSLETLEAEYNAVSTYALDILQWKRQEWIQQLIAAKKAKASGDTDEHKTLLEQVKAEVPKWKARYKKSGKEESELVSRADLSALIHVYRNWENASGVAMEEEAATAEELEKLLTLLTDDYYSFIYRLRDYLRADGDGRSPDTEGLSKEFRRIFTLHARFARDIVDCRKLGETYHIDAQDVVEMMGDFQRELDALEQAVRKQIKASDADISVEDIADRVEVDDIEVVKAMVSKVQLDEAKRPKTDPEPDMNALWDAFNKRFPKWKAKYAESGYMERDLIQASTEAELFDALRVYRDSDRTGPVTAEEIKDVTRLMKSRSYPFALRVRDVLRDKHKQDFSEIDRCYAENQLRVLQSTISPLLERLGADDIAHHDKEILTADLYDVFLEYENVPTEKEMVIALLDLVGSILAEEIPETLDNEVLCPDDEADRQAMHSDLVTSTA